MFEASSCSCSVLSCQPLASRAPGLPEQELKLPALLKFPACWRCSDSRNPNSWFGNKAASRGHASRLVPGGSFPPEGTWDLSCSELGQRRGHPPYPHPAPPQPVLESGTLLFRQLLASDMGWIGRNICPGKKSCLLEMSGALFN